MLSSPSPHGRVQKLSLEKASQQDSDVVQPPCCDQQSRGGTGAAFPVCQATAKGTDLTSSLV